MMSNSNQIRSNLRERGAILVLFVILAPVLLLLLALATDVAFLTGGNIELQRVSDSIALEMLRQYQNFNELEDGCASPCTQCPCPGGCGRLARICAAVDATSALFDTNFRGAAVENRLEKQGEEYSNFIGLRASGDRNNLATVEFGRWFFEFPTGVSVNALPDHCFVGQPAIDNFRPCFEELGVGAINGSNPQQVSAFRVTTASSQSNQFRTFLMHAFGQEVADVGAVSTAAIVPRRGVFIVDTTVSTTEQTHDTSRDSSDKAYFAWDLAPEQCAGIGGSLMSECPSCIGTGEVPGLCPTAASCPVTETLRCQLRYRNWLESAASPNSSQHEREDYSCVEVSYGDSSPSHTFLIDTTMKPQPLGDILSSVNAAMVAFEQRGVAGDRFGFVGFDNELLPVRSTRSDNDNLPFSMVAPGDQGFEDFLRATDLGRQNGIFDGPASQVTDSAFVDFFLFPRLLSYIGGSAMYTGTFLPAALNRANEMLQAVDGFDSADNFIVVFTDGQSNCISSSECNSSADFWTSSRGLVLNGSSLSNDFRDLKDKRVAVHFVLIGDSSTPHERMFKNTSCSDPDDEFCCMDFADYLAAKASDPNYESWVDANDPNFPHPNSGNQTLPGKTEWPNSWYDLSEQTRGWWTPVRPPCSDFRNTGLYPNAEDAVAPIRKAFSTACYQKLNADKTKAITKQNLQNASPGDLFSNITQVIDNKGRVLCDPLSRSVEEQLTDRIRDDILGYSPFQLVE